MNTIVVERRRRRRYSAEFKAEAVAACLQPGISTAAVAMSARLALMQYIDDGNLPMDNNWLKNRIPPVALGRANWLFAGSLRAGKRAAVVMSLVQSAKLNGHDPYRYLADILARLPTQPAGRLKELLPHCWTTSSR